MSLYYATQCLYTVKFQAFGMWINEPLLMTVFPLLLRNFPSLLKSFYQEGLREAGCDEAGRGCYAGPVFAAAVILPEGFYHPLLNDSKQVSPDDREELRVYIEANAMDYAVAMVDHEEIDKINILKASFRAMHLALDQLKLRPKLLLIDGNRFVKYRRTAHRCIVQGDGIYASIAAASILAKTGRDKYMRQLHEEYPHYRWDSNKGYGTREHRAAIAQFGLCKYHRRSFNIDPANPEQAEDLTLFQDQTGL
jgi:ribonuclease HII